MPQHGGGLHGKLLTTGACSPGRCHKGASREEDPCLFYSIFLHLSLPRPHRSMRLLRHPSQLSYFRGACYLRSTFHGVIPGAETPPKMPWREHSNRNCFLQLCSQHSHVTFFSEPRKYPWILSPSPAPSCYETTPFFTPLYPMG